MPRDENMIAALLRERAGYEAQGKTARVEQVNEQLAHHGYDPDETDENAGPEGRTAPPRQSADSGTGDGTAQTAAPAKKTTAAKKTAAPPAK